MGRGGIHSLAQSARSCSAGLPIKRVVRWPVIPARLHRYLVAETRYDVATMRSSAEWVFRIDQRQSEPCAMCRTSSCSSGTASNSPVGGICVPSEDRTAFTRAGALVQRNLWLVLFVVSAGLLSSDTVKAQGKALTEEAVLQSITRGQKALISLQGPGGTESAGLPPFHTGAGRDVRGVVAADGLFRG